MALTLTRDAKVFLSTVDIGWNDTNTWEIKVLDGFSFSQSTSTQEVTLNEAGAAPNRGQKIFNTALDPVDISFSTYVRPYIESTVPTPGLQVITLGPSASYGDDTGLTPETTYDFNINVDAGGVQTIAITTDVGTVTVADVLTLVNVQLVATAQAATMDLHAGNFRVISEVAGAGSSIAITDAAGGAPYLFASAQMSGFSTVTVETTVSGSASGTNHTSVEKVLWDAITNNGAQATPGAMNIDFANSNAHELPFFYMYINTGAAIYRMEEMIVNAAEIDFSIDSIGQIAWTSQASFYEVVTAGTSPDPSQPGVDFLAAPVTADFLKNKLSTITMSGGPANGGAGATYELGLTSASVSIDNGVTFLVPEELGVVNKSIGHFTGTRAITCTFSCYLDTAANKSMSLLSDMLADVNSATPTITNAFNLQLNMGGVVAPYVSFEMPRAHIVIPQIESEDVISTTIEATALGTGLTTTDELNISYYAA